MTNRVPSIPEARESVHRLVNSHFDNPGEHGRFSIPARPDRDDDLLLLQFVDRVECQQQLLVRLRAYVARTAGLFDRERARDLIAQIDALPIEGAAILEEPVERVIAIEIERLPDGGSVRLELRKGDGHSISGMPAEGWIVRRDANGAETSARYPMDLQTLSISPAPRAGVAP